MITPYLIHFFYGVNVNFLKNKLDSPYLKSYQYDLQLQKWD